jgi:uridine kinase
MQQEALFRKLSEAIFLVQKQKNKPLRIAINGVEGTGKTTFVSAFCDYLQKKDLEAIHVPIDGFHYNKKHRYQQGRNSARGYYEDSYNEAVFVTKVLVASQKEFPNYTIAAHDLESDAYLDLEPTPIFNKAILLTDGAYLLKPIFLEHWDFKIYLYADFEVAIKRGANRDKEALGGFEAAEEKFIERYHAASKMYIEACQPQEKADWVIDTNDFKNYKVLKES